MTAARAALVAALAILGAPAVAPAATAPGRVAYPVTAKVPTPGLHALGSVSSVALPDGGVLAMTDWDLTIVRLRADAPPSCTFGSGGIALPPVPDGTFILHRASSAGPTGVSSSSASGRSATGRRSPACSSRA